MDGHVAFLSRISLKDKNQKTILRRQTEKLDDGVFSCASARLRRIAVSTSSLVRKVSGDGGPCR